MNLKKSVDAFKVREEEYLNALSTQNIKKINLITQAIERRNIEEFSNQVYDHLSGKKNSRYMDHELPIILSFINEKAKLIPISDFEYNLSELNRSNESEASYIINDDGAHYYCAQVKKNKDKTLVITIEDSIRTSTCSQKLESQVNSYKKNSKVDCKINISNDRVAQKSGYECGPSSIYNLNKKLFNEKFSLNHKSIKDDSSYESFFKKIYLADALLFHASIIYEALKEKYKDRIVGEGCIGEEDFDAFYKEIALDRVASIYSSRTLLGNIEKGNFNNNEVSRKEFNDLMDSFDVSFESFMDNELKNLPSLNDLTRINQFKIDASNNRAESNTNEANNAGANIKNNNHNIGRHAASETSKRLKNDTSQITKI